MNKQKIFILTTGIILTLSACKKNDLQEELPTTDPVVAAAVKAAGWHSIANWSTTAEETSVIYNGSLTDTALNDATIEDGLVLVYKKEGRDIQSLPLEENGSFWYYQISENTLEINCEGPKDQVIKDQSFQYILFPAEKVSDLESKGYSKADLMSLSHENARALLNN